MATETLKRKLTNKLHIKSMDELSGVVVASVNTQGAPDLDDDILLPGCFDKSIAKLERDPIAILFGHDTQTVVGKLLDGWTVHKDDGTAELHAEMLFNMDTQAGRDCFSNISFGSIAQFSVGFNARHEDMEIVQIGNKSYTQIKEVQLVEISAVLRGASKTGLISVKNADEIQKGAIPAHDSGTAPDDQEWDSAAEIAKLPNDADPSVYRAMYAYVIEGANESAKGSYKLPHHDVVDGEATDANMRGTQSAVGVLNGAMGGVDIPDGDRAAVYAHLAAHLRAGGLEPAELKTKEEVNSNTYTTEAEALARASELGCDGRIHEMQEGENTYYMPCSDHAEYESYLNRVPEEVPAGIYSQDTENQKTDTDATQTHAEQQAAAAKIHGLAASEIARVKLEWLKQKTGD